VVSFDISLPLSALPSFISAGKAKLAQTHPDLRINCFGHVGDGNLHFNVFPPSRKKAADYKDLSSRIRHDIYDLVHDYSGSFSAEHGVGRDKVVELRRYADPTRLQTMRALKAALDPLNIFNPGALFAQVD
ncbi:MAG: FAD-binding oxidoreductase, partial [Granulosicoccaceae bacterium]